MKASMTNLPPTETDIKLATAYLNGALDEDELRNGFIPADSAIIEALKKKIATLRNEIDELAADIRAAQVVVQEQVDYIELTAEVFDKAGIWTGPLSCDSCPNRKEFSQSYPYGNTVVKEDLWECREGYEQPEEGRVCMGREY